MDAVALLVIAIVALPAASVVAAVLPFAWWRDDRRWELVAGATLVALAAACGALTLDESGSVGSDVATPVRWAWLPAFGDMRSVDVALRREPVWLLLAAACAGTLAAALLAQADAGTAGTRAGAAARGALVAATSACVLASDTVVAWIAWSVAGWLLSLVERSTNSAEDQSARRAIAWERATDVIGLGALLYLSVGDVASWGATQSAPVVASLAILAAIVARLRLLPLRRTARADDDRCARDRFEATRWAAVMPVAAALLWRFRPLFHDSDVLRVAASVAGIGLMMFAGATALTSVIASHSRARGESVQALSRAPAAAALGMLVFSLGERGGAHTEPALRWTLLVGSTAALLPILHLQGRYEEAPFRRAAGALGLALIAGVSGQHEIFARGLADGLKAQSAAAIVWAAAILIAQVAGGLAVGLWCRALGHTTSAKADGWRGPTGPAIFWALVGIAASSAPWWAPADMLDDIVRQLGIDRPTSAPVLPWLATVWPALCGLVAATFVPQVPTSVEAKPMVSSPPREKRGVVWAAMQTIRLLPEAPSRVVSCAVAFVAWALRLAFVTAPGAALRLCRTLHDAFDSPEVGLPLLMTILALAVLALCVA